MLNAEQNEFLKSLLTRARLRIIAPKTQTTYLARTTEDQRSGSGPDERDPASLAALINSLVVNKGWDLNVVVGKLHASWPTLVGEQISSHVSIEDVRLNPNGQSGVLILRAESTAWATQVRILIPQIHEQIRADFGADVISEIQVLGPTAPSWKHGLRSTPGRGPRDTYG
jgi:hypothetical protein